MTQFSGNNSATLPETVRKEMLLARMKEITADPGHPLMAAAVGILKDGEILFADMVGCKRSDGTPATADTKYRIASISKLLTAVGVWQLIEQGRIDPEADVSSYLGFSLRNPHHPHIPITVKMLLSHTSSIRDGGKPGSYNIPLGCPISAFFTEGSTFHMPRCWAPKEEVPGIFFSYCNMNYCLLGTVIEAVSGKRFDHYMTDHVFAPMGLSCSFHVWEMPEEVRAQVGTLYLKLNQEGDFDPVNGTWVPQCDDFSNGCPHTDYSGYTIGTNGSLFGPMGSLRVSIRELCQIMRMFCCDGRHNGAQILKPETVQRMFTPVWTYDPLQKNGDTYLNIFNCYGMGPHILTNQDMGDRLVPDQHLPFAGHSADAYGMLGGMFFDRKKGNGIVYMAAGTGSDKSLYFGKYSSFYRWEEALLCAGAQFARFSYESHAQI